MTKKSFGATSMVYPTPVWLVGSYDKDGKPNALAVAWGGICCSKPPAVTVSLRKATYSYAALMERQAYTVNVPSEAQLREADYFGIASGRDTDKFADTKFTPVKSDLVDAPYIAECPMVIECKVIHTYEIGLHTQFIGEILDVKVDQDALNDEGLPDMKKVAPILFGPSKVRAYYGVGDYLGQGYAVGKNFKR